MDELTDDNYPLAVELASLAGKLRGYGHVKDRNREKLTGQREALLARFRGQEELATIKIYDAA